MTNEIIKVTTNEEGQHLVSGRELHEALGVRKAFSTWVQLQLTNINAIENTDFTIVWYDMMKNVVPFENSVNSMVAKGCSRDYILSLDIAKHICQKQTKNTKSVEILQYLYLNDDKEVFIIENPRKEVEFLDILETQLNVIFGELKLERQYSKLKCSNYRIDLYIKDFNIAIEYDENGHKHYSDAQHLQRQKLIEEELGCRFIRVSDDKSHIENSAIVIKTILNL